MIFFSSRYLKQEDLLQCDLFIFLGMTKTDGPITMQTSYYKNESCRTVLPNVQLKVVDPESGKVMGPNQSEELWVHSMTMMNSVITTILKLQTVQLIKTVKRFFFLFNTIKNITIIKDNRLFIY
jgi:acyl-coenzyme A synthetase/AMP-(fatty) acid ligase